MLPASLVGILFLTALVPGFIFLKGTGRHRRANHNPSALEEAVTLVAVGLSISGPVLLVVTWTLAGQVADQLRWMSKPATASVSDIRAAGELFVVVIAASVGIAAIASWAYQTRNPIRSGESAWYDVLSAEKDGHIQMVSITLKDTTIVDGVLYTYDGIPIGPARNIALSPPIRVVSAAGVHSRIESGHVVISESDIHSFAARHQPIAGA